MSLYPKLDSVYLSSDDEKDDSEGFRDSSALGRPELCSREAHVQKKAPRVNTVRVKLQVALLALNPHKEVVETQMLPSPLRTLNRST